MRPHCLHPNRTWIMGKYLLTPIIVASCLWSWSFDFEKKEENKTTWNRLPEQLTVVLGPQEPERKREFWCECPREHLKAFEWKEEEEKGWNVIICELMFLPYLMDIWPHTKAHHRLSLLFHCGSLGIAWEISERKFTPRGLITTRHDHHDQFRWLPLHDSS